MKTNKGTIHAFMIDLLIVSILCLFACGDAGPDRIQIRPQETSLEIGEDFQFKAKAFTKDNKEIPNTVFAWQVQGDAGSINESGKFLAKRPGEVIILAKSGNTTGTAKVLVRSGQNAEGAEQASIDVPEVIIIDNQAFEEWKKGAVKLSHRKHVEEYGVSCVECHHEYEDGKNIWTENDPVKRCVTCHDPTETKDDIIKLQFAYHNNCKDCHKAVVEEDDSKNAPYIKCADCHEDSD